MTIGRLTQALTDAARSGVYRATREAEIAEAARPYYEKMRPYRLA